MVCKCTKKNEITKTSGENFFTQKPATLEACEDPDSLETPTPTRRRLPAASKLRDSRVDSGSVDLGTPLEMSPKSPLEVLDEALSSVMIKESSSPVAPPRAKCINGTL